ncbi:hypothetical protein GWC95_16640 [Sediminibacterium roseum]|uniref:MG2 domain-containing protein n=1 Tax=Sediminibacterium roseum TaxID=1978412 RepID=A0ABW9ZZ77_9BACT|nr:hypothetical protein [Sediminibacterium roseum]NCI51559.1 hypothetical protein [Sediminibacterium roseum]
MNLLRKINRTQNLMLAGLLLLAGAAQAQLTTGTLEKKFNQFRINNLQEKMYLHVDRNFYLAGDILWCKAYVVDATLHQPLDLSKVAYVEVLDENNNAVLQAKLELDKGKGNGSIAIPSSIKSGNYKLRGYTNWMKNAGPDYFFEKIITIVNTQKNRENTVTNVAKKTTAPEIALFPEGGYLVEGISSVVACKVTAAGGKGEGFKGTIVDENNRTVATFQAFMFGMGRFTFKPEAGHTYKAQIETVSGTYTKELPQVFSKGYVMSLNADNRINVTVQSNVDEGRNVYLLVHTRQSLKATLQAVITNGRAVFSIDPSKIGEGVSQFTLFNGDGKALCERLYFTHPTQKLSIGVSGNLPSYNTRSKIDFELRPSSKNSSAQHTDMSVAVYRADELQGLEDQDIQSVLWLSSDLKGRIESPAFYFNGSSAAKEAMENLVLTQGWRRFKWDDVMMERNAASFVAEHSGHIVTGKVINSQTGKAMPNIEAYLSVPGRNANFRVGLSDAQGRLRFDVQHMRGSSEVIVQTDPLADTLSRIELNSPFAEQFSSSTIPPFYLSAANENLLREQSIGVQVQSAYAGTQLKTFVANMDTTSLLFSPNGIYMLDDYTRFTTMEEVLREYVGLMDVQNRGGNFRFLMLEDYDIPMADLRMTNFYQTNPLVLVDGVPVFNMNKLIAFDPLKMRKLEAYNKRYFMGESSYPGILNWTSYKGDFAGFELEPRALVLDYEGPQLEREFYSPVHDGSEKDERLPDFRTLLYWSHSVPADAKGERRVNFYTSDKKGDYVVVVQALGDGGDCGSTMFKFEVK